MDVPRTQSGTPCKLCRSRGSLCHIHGSISPKKSITKSQERWDELLGTFGTPRSQSPSFDFLNLPKPALFEVLLKLEPNELKALISLKNPKIHSIVKLGEFKRRYDIMHNAFTAGEIKVVDKKFLNIEMEKLYVIINSSSSGFIVTLETSRFTVDIILSKGRMWHLHISTSSSSSSPAGNGELIWIKLAGTWIEVDHNIKKGSLVMVRLTRVLNLIKKTKWLPERKRGNFTIDDAFPKELFEIVEYLLRSNGIPFSLKWE